jgi:hypothetical protein
MLIWNGLYNDFEIIQMLRGGFDNIFSLPLVAQQFDQNNIFTFTSLFKPKAGAMTAFVQQTDLEMSLMGRSAKKASRRVLGTKFFLVSKACLGYNENSTDLFCSLNPTTFMLLSPYSKRTMTFIASFLIVPKDATHQGGRNKMEMYPT